MKTSMIVLSYMALCMCEGVGEDSGHGAWGMVSLISFMACGNSCRNVYVFT